MKFQVQTQRKQLLLAEIFCWYTWSAKTIVTLTFRLTFIVCFGKVNINLDVCVWMILRTLFRTMPRHQFANDSNNVPISHDQPPVPTIIGFGLLEE